LDLLAHESGTASARGESSMTSFVPPKRALELRVGRARIAIPVGVIARVLAIRWSPLPLAHQLVAGLGFDGERTIVCVSINPTHAQTDDTKAVLFDTGGRIGFGLCIEEAVELVDVTSVERGTVQATLPRWIRRARTTDGRTLGWIDADVLIGELTGEHA
jgi:hypothetical protein